MRFKTCYFWKIVKLIKYNTPKTNTYTVILPNEQNHHLCICIILHGQMFATCIYMYGMVVSHKLVLLFHIYEIPQGHEFVHPCHIICDKL